MLAHSFKSAAELKLTPQIYEGLKKVLVRLETGDLMHYGPELVDYNRFWNAIHKQIPSNGFSMRVVLHHVGCGTIGCLAGWASIEAGMAKFGTLLNYAEHNRPLHNLFYPPDRYAYGLITPEQAACVLRYYLTTGVTDWERVLGPSNC